MARWSPTSTCLLHHVSGRYHVHPRVYFKITDNWSEITVRFLAKDREIRELKDAITREILDWI